ncbi:DUF421 domain-containing protein [Anaerospora sp.]|jgi:uncharacterized membrane protein YcaP (DUF421 family)|uniref:DUF421 domain-containing protein n=1 Tax=Anaerospora sp. TaxID=1960278 RepID=UPI0028A0AB59|nr:DUF421 domain-containing protein [Anaerospora sp.]
MSEDLSIAVRTVFMLFVLLLISRLLGRRTLSELTFYDFVMGLTLGQIGASVITEAEFSLRSGLIGMITATIWVIAINMLSLKFIPARKLLEAEPLLVMYRGKIMEENLKKRFYNINDLLEMLREQGIFDPAQVDLALIESDGELSILKKQAFQSPTIKDLQLPQQEPANSLSIGTELIIDGKLIDQGLVKKGLTTNWLQKQLLAEGITDYEAVALAMITPDGTLYVDKKADSSISDMKKPN